jgi:hypothetical protein
VLNKRHDVKHPFGTRGIRWKNVEIVVRTGCS